MSQPLIPLSTLFAPPSHQRPLISPDGTHVAWLGPVDHIVNIWIRLPDGSTRPVTDERQRAIREYMWAQDNRHVLYPQDLNGDENWHIFATDIQRGLTRDLTPLANVAARLLGSSSAQPDCVLIALNATDPRRHDVYRVQVGTGELEQVTEEEGAFAFAYDEKLRVLAALRASRDGTTQLLTRSDEGLPFAPVRSWPMDELSVVGSNLSMTADGTRIHLLTADGADAARIVELDLAGNTIRVLLGDPTYDVTEFNTEPLTHEPMLAVVLRERADLVALQPEFEADVAYLRGFHPGDPTVLSSSSDNSVWTVVFLASGGPSTYFRYDRGARHCEFLFVDRPQLADHELSTQEPFSFPAEDGLTIHGYLSFPPGQARQALPAVLWVHGGPWMRDRWFYDPTVQFLASRGYLVVQVNYRGSAGYGKAYLRAGDRESGGRMFTDLTDAVRHLVELGVVDAERVAIAGASYGGYQALLGATFAPDTFACAVDLVGMSNLITLIKSFPPYWDSTLALWHKRLGHPDDDREFLWSRSPLSRVDDIRIPLLVAQGANDPRVVKAESDQIVEAMVSRGIPHTYLVFEDEGHGFARPQNRLRFSREVEIFLAEHLGGRCGPEPVLGESA